MLTYSGKMPHDVSMRLILGIQPAVVHRPRSSGTIRASGHAECKEERSITRGFANTLAALEYSDDQRRRAAASSRAVSANRITSFRVLQRKDLIMDKRIEDAFNEHLNAEFFSAYLYLSMANYFAAENLEGMASWMLVQTDEERLHAMKFLAYINDRGGRVVLEQIDKPKTKWESPLEAFQEAYAHEQLISKKINDLVDLTIKANAHAAGNFLQWFVGEQVEEEATVQAIVGKLSLIRDNPMGLLMIDQALGQRTASAAADTAN